MDKRLRKLQLIEIELLDEYVRICDKYDLTYYINYGTLLGAVRHKGFIPWDDDLDVVMPCKDYEKFCQIADKEIDHNKFYFHDYKDPRYYDGLVRIRRKGTIYSDKKSMRKKKKNYGIWMDIFRLDNVDNPHSLVFRYQTMAKKILGHICFHRAMVDLNNLSLNRKIVHYISCILPLGAWNHLRDWSFRLCKNDNTKYVINFASRYKASIELIEREKYGQPVKIEFEGKLYNAPHEYEYILKHIYGDYMKLPPVEKRGVDHNPEVWEINI